MSHLCEEVLQNNQVENKDANEECSADTTAVMSPKNKEVIYEFDIIRRRLQFEGENMDAFFRLERKMQDSMQNKIKQTTIAQCFV